MSPLSWYGRVVSRLIAQGLPTQQSSSSTIPSPNSALSGAQFVSVVAGFPKDLKSGKMKKGQIGEDAWVIARSKAGDVLGVADGVGGWRQYGVDPGLFSSGLLRAVDNLVSLGMITPSRPASLLASAFRELRNSKMQVVGSSTACLLVLSREDNKLYSANIGDSGFLVVRGGEVVHRSEEQQHYFNTPYQLSLPPPGQRGHVLSDSPESADQSQFPVQDGDVILMATDGVFDNVPDTVLLGELTKISGVRDPSSLQQTANAIALIARTLAFDSRFVSPFAKNARQAGIHAIGGKPDDITVLLATVAI
ncbi:protein phosphatase PTC7 homolog [Artemia franciscana]|uniref:Protein phosphatase n=1 Tax=Artemia franciscana TaxID=6661 RepID=A0AA88LG94_ARTSF|nr:hypothetical protein QYM36_000295 [Artemia franciscana]KAK2725759.1 hypothetical protein QYM36_000295 [Artemia franciscana]KAK2725760.1 hypothetical protein QYM36_000295 [Artemia franciscana]